MLHFLFPAHPLEPDEPDDLFAEQFRALVARGFSASIFPESVISEGRRLRGVPDGAVVVYRGWMLRGPEYAGLAQAVERAGAAPLTTPEQYLAAHHLPNWYPLIADHTPETRVYPADANMPRELAALGWDAYFVKDYVKSLKTSVGSIVRSPSDVVVVIDEMRKYRGEIEGGICVRRVEEFEPDSEVRYFVIAGTPFAPVQERAIPEVVRACARVIPGPFFSADVILRRDGAERVVEVGDGQVSDLVGWTAERFAEVWERGAAVALAASERGRAPTTG